MILLVDHVEQEMLPNLPLLVQHPLTPYPTPLYASYYPLETDQLHRVAR